MPTGTATSIGHQGAKWLSQMLLRWDPPHQPFASESNRFARVHSLETKNVRSARFVRLHAGSGCLDHPGCGSFWQNFSEYAHSNIFVSEPIFETGAGKKCDFQSTIVPTSAKASTRYCVVEVSRLKNSPKRALAA